MDTNYTREDLERILFKMESRPTDGLKDRINAIKAMLAKMDEEEPKAV